MPPKYLVADLVRRRLGFGGTMSDPKLAARRCCRRTWRNVGTSTQSSRIRFRLRDVNGEETSSSSELLDPWFLGVTMSPSCDSIPKFVMSARLGFTGGVSIRRDEVNK